MISQELKDVFSDRAFDIYDRVAWRDSTGSRHHGQVVALKVAWNREGVYEHQAIIQPFFPGDSDGSLRPIPPTVIRDVSILEKP